MLRRLKRPSQEWSVATGYWPPRKWQRARSQQPKVRNHQERPSQITDTPIHRGERVTAEGGSKVARFTSCGGLRSGVWGNTQSASTVSALFPACMTPWMGDGVIFFNWSSQQGGPGVSLPACEWISVADALCSCWQLLAPQALAKLAAIVQRTNSGTSMYPAA